MQQQPQQVQTKVTEEAMIDAVLLLGLLDFLESIKKNLENEESQDFSNLLDENIKYIKDLEINKMGREKFSEIITQVNSYLSSSRDVKPMLLGPLVVADLSSTTLSTNELAEIDGERKAAQKNVDFLAEAISYVVVPESRGIISIDQFEVAVVESEMAGAKGAGAAAKPAAPSGNAEETEEAVMNSVATLFDKLTKWYASIGLSNESAATQDAGAGELDIINLSLSDEYFFVPVSDTSVQLEQGKALKNISRALQNRLDKPTVGENDLFSTPELKDNEQRTCTAFLFELEHVFSNHDDLVARRAGQVRKLLGEILMVKGLFMRLATLVESQRHPIDDMGKLCEQALFRTLNGLDNIIVASKGELNVQAEIKVLFKNMIEENVTLLKSRVETATSITRVASRNLHARIESLTKALKDSFSNSMSNKSKSGGVSSTQHPSFLVLRDEKKAKATLVANIKTAEDNLCKFDERDEVFEELIKEPNFNKECSDALEQIISNEGRAADAVKIVGEFYIDNKELIDSKLTGNQLGNCSDIKVAVKSLLQVIQSTRPAKQGAFFAKLSCFAVDSLASKVENGDVIFMIPAGDTKLKRLSLTLEEKGLLSRNSEEFYNKLGLKPGDKFFSIEQNSMYSLKDTVDLAGLLQDLDVTALDDIDIAEGKDVIVRRDATCWGGESWQMSESLKALTEEEYKQCVIDSLRISEGIVDSSAEISEPNNESLAGGMLGFVRRLSGTDKKVATKQSVFNKCAAMLRKQETQEHISLIGQCVEQSELVDVANDYDSLGKIPELYDDDLHGVTPNQFLAYLLYFDGLVRDESNAKTTAKDLFKARFRLQAMASALYLNKDSEEKLFLPANYHVAITFDEQYASNNAYKQMLDSKDRGVKVFLDFGEDLRTTNEDSPADNQIEKLKQACPEFDDFYKLCCAFQSASKYMDGNGDIVEIHMVADFIGLFQQLRTSTSGAVDYSSVEFIACKKEFAKLLPNVGGMYDLVSKEGEKLAFARDHLGFDQSVLLVETNKEKIEKIHEQLSLIIKDSNGLEVRTKVESFIKIIKEHNDANQDEQQALLNHLDIFCEGLSRVTGDERINILDVIFSKICLVVGADLSEGAARDARKLFDSELFSKGVDDAVKHNDISSPESVAFVALLAEGKRKFEKFDQELSFKATQLAGYYNDFTPRETLKDKEGDVASYKKFIGFHQLVCKRKDDAKDAFFGNGENSKLYQLYEVCYSLTTVDLSEEKLNEIVGTVKDASVDISGLEPHEAVMVELMRAAGPNLDPPEGTTLSLYKKEDTTLSLYKKIENIFPSSFSDGEDGHKTSAELVQVKFKEWKSSVDEKLEDVVEEIDRNNASELSLKILVLNAYFDEKGLNQVGEYLPDSLLAAGKFQKLTDLKSILEEEPELVALLVAVAPSDRIGFYTSLLSALDGFGEENQRQSETVLGKVEATRAALTGDKKISLEQGFARQIAEIYSDGVFSQQKHDKLTRDLDSQSESYIAEAKKVVETIVHAKDKQALDCLLSKGTDASAIKFEDVLKYRDSVSPAVFSDAIAGKVNGEVDVRLSAISSVIGLAGDFGSEKVELFQFLKQKVVLGGYKESFDLVFSHLDHLIKSKFTAAGSNDKQRNDIYNLYRACLINLMGKTLTEENCRDVAYLRMSLGESSFDASALTPELPFMVRMHAVAEPVDDNVGQDNLDTLNALAAKIDLKTLAAGVDDAFKFKKQSEAATRISAWRRMSGPKAEFQVQKKAAIKIEAQQRGRKQRAELQQQQAAATKIQAQQRMRRPKGVLQAQKAAALKIQAHQRGYAQRAELIKTDNRILQKVTRVEDSLRECGEEINKLLDIAEKHEVQENLFKDEIDILLGDKTDGPYSIRDLINLVGQDYDEALFTSIESEISEGLDGLEGVIVIEVAKAEAAKAAAEATVTALISGVVEGMVEEKAAEMVNAKREEAKAAATVLKSSFRRRKAAEMVNGKREEAKAAAIFEADEKIMEFAQDKCHANIFIAEIHNDVTGLKPGDYYNNAFKEYEAAIDVLVKCLDENKPTKDIVDATTTVAKAAAIVEANKKITEFARNKFSADSLIAEIHKDVTDLNTGDYYNNAFKEYEAAVRVLIECLDENKPTKDIVDATNDVAEKHQAMEGYNSLAQAAEAKLEWYEHYKQVFNCEAMLGDSGPQYDDESDGLFREHLAKLQSKATVTPEQIDNANSFIDGYKNKLVTGIEDPEPYADGTVASEIQGKTAEDLKTAVTEAIDNWATKAEGGDNDEAHYAMSRMHEFLQDADAATKPDADSPEYYDKLFKFFVEGLLLTQKVPKAKQFLKCDGHRERLAFMVLHLVCGAPRANGVDSIKPDTNVADLARSHTQGAGPGLFQPGPSDAARQIFVELELDSLALELGLVSPASGLVAGAGAGADANADASADAGGLGAAHENGDTNEVGVGGGDREKYHSCPKGEGGSPKAVPEFGRLEKAQCSQPRARSNSAPAGMHQDSLIS